MAEIHRIGLDEVARHFEELEDPRSSVNRLHPLVSVVVIALMAVLAGADGPTAIAKWAGLEKEELLLKVLDLPNGIPCKDVFRRVLMLIKPSAFQPVCELAAIAACKGRGGHRRDPTDLAGRWQDSAAEPRSRQGLGGFAFGQRLGQRVRVVAGASGRADKLNEITAIPELL